MAEDRALGARHREERLDLAPEPRPDGREAQVDQHPVGRVEPGRAPAAQRRDEARVAQGLLAEPPPARPSVREMGLNGTAQRCCGIRHGPAT